MDTSFAALEPDYAHRWAAMEIRPEWVTRIDRDARRILALKRRFRVIERLTGVHWVEPALQCLREADLDLTKHPHNGDPLDGWTVHVPKHRPTTGSPPFTFEASAADALAYDHITSLSGWSIDLVAYALERVNGFGYREHHAMASPYLWSGTLHYRVGKYGSDGKFEPNLVDQQPGVMPVLKRLMELDPSIHFDRLIEAGPPRLTDTLVSHPVATKALGVAGAALVATAPAALAGLSPGVLALLAGAAIGIAAKASVDLIRHHHHLTGLAD